MYGLTTQVGHGKDTLLTEEEIRGEQMFVKSQRWHRARPAHPAGTRCTGRSTQWDRLRRVRRLPAVADVLAAMLNAGVHPIVPEISSVGAADIGQMAGMRRSQSGWAAEYQGELLPGDEAMRPAGITPLVLSGRWAGVDIRQRGIDRPGRARRRPSRTGGGCGRRRSRALDGGDRREPVDPASRRRACQVGPRPGDGGRPYPEPAGREPAAPAGRPRSVQDALSFRVVPQVHGALREYVAHARRP